MAKRWRGRVGQARRGVFGELERRSCRLALDAGLTQTVEDLLPRAGDRAGGIRIVATPTPAPALREHDRSGDTHATEERARDQRHDDLPVEREASRTASRARRVDIDLRRVARRRRGRRRGRRGSDRRARRRRGRGGRRRGGQARDSSGAAGKVGVGCGLEARPPDTGEPDLTPRVRVLRRHPVDAGDAVVAAGCVADGDARRKADGAGHRGEAARELHAEAGAALQELADGVLALRVGGQVDVEGVVEPLRRVEEEALQGAGAVVRVGGPAAVIACAASRTSEGKSDGRRV